VKTLQEAKAKAEKQNHDEKAVKRMRFFYEEDDMIPEYLFVLFFSLLFTN
jgi:hypothetical protein